VNRNNKEGAPLDDTRQGQQRKMSQTEWRVCWSVVVVAAAACVAAVRGCHNPVAATDTSRTVSFFGSARGRLGEVVNAAGDVNGDGFDDVVIAAPDIMKNSSTIGEVYLVFGRSTQ